MTERSWVYELGALVEPHEVIALTFGELEPLQSYASTITMLEREVHDDGWLYPPAVHRHRMTLGGSEVGRVDAAEIERKPTRPAHLYSLPPTHLLTYRGADAHDVDRAVPDFLLHVLGFLYGTRLQFSDWFIDQRVRVRRQNGLYPWQPASPFSFDHAELVEILDAASARARALDASDFRLLRNIIATHNRCPAYEWAWERFAWRYSTFDALWKLLRPRNPRSMRHGDRIAEICKALRIPDDHTAEVNQEERERIVTLRNDLVHEATWNGAGLDQDGDAQASRADIFLGKLNERLIMHALELDCDFRCTPWRSFSQQPFRKYAPQNHGTMSDGQAVSQEQNRAQLCAQRVAHDSSRADDVKVTEVPT